LKFPLGEKMADGGLGDNEKEREMTPSLFA
jgi:hypothetical protein